MLAEAKSPPELWKMLGHPVNMDAVESIIEAAAQLDSSFQKQVQAIWEIGMWWWIQGDWGGRGDGKNVCGCCVCGYCCVDVDIQHMTVVMLVIGDHYGDHAHHQPHRFLHCSHTSHT